MENIEFLVHILSVYRAAGDIDDDAFEQMLKSIMTMTGRAEFANRFAKALEAEDGNDV